MKKNIRFLSVIFTLLFLFSLNQYNVVLATNEVYLGGMTAGFSLQTRGVEVVGLCDVVTELGTCSPGQESGLIVGDVILSIDGADIFNANDIAKNINKKKVVNVNIKRKSEDLTKNVKVAKDLAGQYKLGVFIRDCISGIGTITYVKGNRFASLGHPVLDSNGETLDVIGGNIFSCNITGCVKGLRGSAGELKGVFLRKDPIATIDKNSEYGVYGTVYKNFDFTNLIKIEIGCAQVGDAVIYSTVNAHEVKEYNVSIVKTDYDTDSKNFVIKIEDEELLSCTGGIVQGMSGSPIVQNGKLVGAVTHVFINDPTRGFGISISNMINN